MSNKSRKSNFVLEKTDPAPIREVSLEFHDHGVDVVVDGLYVCGFNDFSDKLQLYRWTKESGTGLQVDDKGCVLFDRGNVRA